MARGSSRGQRDDNSVANSQLLSSLVQPVEPSPIVDPLFDDPLLTFEDRRGYHPEGVNRPSLLRGFSDAVISYPQQLAQNIAYDISGRRHIDRLRSRFAATLAFRDPKRVAICVRRQIRREVVFALSIHRKVGRGAGKHRRRNWASAIRC